MTKRKRLDSGEQIAATEAPNLGRDTEALSHELLDKPVNPEDLPAASQTTSKHVD